MSDEHAWIASLDELESPAYWDDVVRRTSATPTRTAENGEETVALGELIPEELGDVLMQIDEDLAEEVDLSGDPANISDLLPRTRAQVSPLREPSSDPAFRYVKEISKAPTLNVLQETDLARRLLAVEMAPEILSQANVEGKLDRRRVRDLIRSVRGSTGRTAPRPTRTPSATCTAWSEMANSPSAS